MNSRKVALLSLTIALAMILSYVESQIPSAVAIPGVKMGLANLAVIFTLYKLGIKGIVNFTREHFILPDGMIKTDVDVVSTIQELVFEVNALKK